MNLLDLKSFINLKNLGESGKGRSNFRGKTLSNNDKKEMKFVSQGQGKEQAAVYATVKDETIHHILKSYNN